MISRRNMLAHAWNGVPFCPRSAHLVRAVLSTTSLLAACEFSHAAEFQVVARTGEVAPSTGGAVFGANLSSAVVDKPGAGVLQRRTPARRIGDLDQRHRDLLRRARLAGARDARRRRGTDDRLTVEVEQALAGDTQHGVAHGLIGGARENSSHDGLQLNERSQRSVLGLVAQSADRLNQFASGDLGLPGIKPIAQKSRKPAVDENMQAA